MLITTVPKRISLGPISKNFSPRVVSKHTRFHAFIIKVNNSTFLLTLAAGLQVEIIILTFKKNYFKNNEALKQKN